MRRPLVPLLIALTLLLQGLGSAWAASSMAAGEVQMAVHSAALAELPPCHQATMAAEEPADDGTMRDCCGTGVCHCVMGCGGVPALGLAAMAELFQRQIETLTEPAERELPAPHYGPPLRPPATRSS